MSNQGAPAQHPSDDDWWHTVYAGPAGTLPDAPGGGTGEGSVDDWFDSAVTLIDPRPEAAPPPSPGAPAAHPTPASTPDPAPVPSTPHGPTRRTRAGTAAAEGATGAAPTDFVWPPEPAPTAAPAPVAPSAPDPAPVPERAPGPETAAERAVADGGSVDDWFDSALGLFDAPRPEPVRPPAPDTATTPDPGAASDSGAVPGPDTAPASGPAAPAAAPARALPPLPPLPERRRPRPQPVSEPAAEQPSQAGRPGRAQQVEWWRQPQRPVTSEQRPAPRTDPGPGTGPGATSEPRTARPAVPAPGDTAPAAAAPAVPAPAAPLVPAAPPVPTAPPVPATSPAPAAPLLTVPPQAPPRREPVSAPVPFVGERPPTYAPEPTALPAAEPDGLSAVVPDTVLDGAQYGSAILRAVSVRGDSARFRGEPRRDALLVTRFGEGADGLMLAVVAAPGRGEDTPQAAAAAAEAARQLAAAIGRSSSELAADLRAGARDRLRYGLQRLTARAAVPLRPADRPAGASTGAAGDAGETAEGDVGSLHCLMVSLDPDAGHRAAFGTGPGGLYLLRSGHWIDAYAARLLHHPEGEPAAEAVAPQAPRPFRFRLVPATPGDILLLCTPGLAGPIADEPAVARFLSGHWAHPHPPGTVDFLRQVQVRAKGYADDRTAAALWTE